ncbi:hypothetical protein IAD21_03094 [Abditibacteriota bacterium]|nr:hypothetical protein IAD21_03094 [Abditibacteriota bacterium]
MRSSYRSLLFALALAPLSLATPARAQMQGFRPPSVPLVTHDPLFSIWSPSNKAYSSNTRHWTQREHALTTLIRVDDQAFRVMGTGTEEMGAIKQTDLKITPTRSIYTFQSPKITLTLTFTSPLLPDDMDILMRPVTYISYSVVSRDGKPHAIKIMQAMAAVISVNTPDEPTRADSERMNNMAALSVGAVEPTLLRPAGDDTRINWGKAYLAAPGVEESVAGSAENLMNYFSETGGKPFGGRIISTEPRFPSSGNTVALILDAGEVGNTPVERHSMVAYDEEYAIRFFSQNLRPYWRRKGATIQTLLPQAEREYGDLMKRCAAFDSQLMADMTQVGGERYAQLSALAYRQGLAGCGFAADSNGMPMIFTKENSSNGCIATTDLIYPAAPQFLLLSSALAKGLVAPVLVYSTSPRWKFSFAPHDLGVYPQATGQVYGGGEESTNEGEMMPVEESGNMIILMLAIAKMDGNADFSSKWWPQLTAWENYLEKYGKDPENQLCTDDFMGHLAHNANLSVKAILAIAAYGELCRMRGDVTAANKYQALAKEYAANWMQVANDGDHSRLAFDKPNSWSQKYNLVWDKILGLNVFPPSVAKQEVAYYKKVMQPYGVPLDSRTRLTKTDWTLWSATMADNKADFQTMVSPIYDYLNDTTARLPFVDSYITDNKNSDGMRARPVIGGVFIKMLDDPAMWTKYVRQGQKLSNNFAAFPPVPTIQVDVPTSQKVAQTWHYTENRPGANWFAANFDDSGWKVGPGGFGTPGTPGAAIGTEWHSGDIWMRRQVTLPANLSANIQLFAHHDEDLTVYINGVLAAKAAGYTGAYEVLEMRPEARAQLKPGATITLAVSCHQTNGGQYVDVGFAHEVPPVR